MSSYLRNLQRKADKLRADYEPRDPGMKEVGDAVLTIHPTKGKRFTHQRRIAANLAMGRMLDQTQRPRRSKAKPRIYREQAIRKANGAILTHRANANPVVTRQQRRHAERKGIDLSA